MQLGTGLLNGESQHHLRFLLQYTKYIGLEWPRKMFIYNNNQLLLIMTITKYLLPTEFEVCTISKSINQREKRKNEDP